MSTATIINIISIIAVILLGLYAATFNLRYKLWKKRLDKLIDEIKSKSKLRPLNNSELYLLSEYTSNDLNDLYTLLTIYASKTLIVDEKLYKKVCRIIPEYEDKIHFYKALFYQSERDSHARDILSQLEKYRQGTNQ